MSYVRHRDRHVKASIRARIEEALADGGWASGGGYANMGRVVVVDTPLAPEELKPVNPTDVNTVFLEVGSHFNMTELQLGSGIVGFRYPVFVDVLARNSTAAGMIAEDLRDALQGQAPGARHWIPVVNAATGQPLSGFSAEVVEVFKELPDPKKSFWVSLKVGVVLTIPGGGS